jgi:hypothetical protein
VRARSITIRSADGGWDADIYAAATGPPSTLEGWGDPIGTTNGASTDQTIEFESTASARYYLIWITKLSPTTVTGGYRVEIDEVTLNE